MKALWAALAWVALAEAQGPATSTPPPPAQRSPGQTAEPTAKPPQRGYIAPILDIRIQDDGIRLPKPAAEAPPEKPPAK
jgi:hypothetical protein